MTRSAGRGAGGPRGEDDGGRTATRVRAPQPRRGPTGASQHQFAPPGRGQPQQRRSARPDGQRQREQHHDDRHDQRYDQHLPGDSDQHLDHREHPGEHPGERRTSAAPLRASWDPLHAHGERARSARLRREPKANRVAVFFRNYGWRAYALPLLTVLTALAFFWASQPGGAPPAERSGQGIGEQQGTASSQPPETSAAPTPLVPNPDAPGFDEAMASAELPEGGPFTVKGDGTWSLVPGRTDQVGDGQLFTYTVEIEDGVELPGGPEGFAQVVDSTLANPKSWIGSDEYAFRRVDSGTPTLRISLASQETARRICGFSIQFDASCWNGGRAVINGARWERGAVAFQGNLVAYQQYVINHEVGHGLGFGHLSCAEDGALAPVMMQQTWGVANDYLAALGTDNVTADGNVCEPNSWPYPTAGG